MPTSDRSSRRRLQDILQQAFERKNPLERAAFLDGVCGSDQSLRAQIEALLAKGEGGERNPETTPDDTRVCIEGAGTELTPTLLDETPVTEGPGTVIGRYKLLEQIGEGGCGVVYQAEQSEPVKRRVALKVIKLGMDTRQVIARFEAERQALALMDHPNIAKVLDGGTTEAGRPFFVMELVKGVPITRYCDERRLDTSQRLELFILVCQAIQHAHQKGIIHRDIKPSNILVADHEGAPIPKVIDFGIAKATAGQTLTDKTVFTALEQFIGTPAYMSPEQAEMSGLDIDTRSDIYSLGVLLYELLIGKTPFDAKRLVQTGLEGICRIIRQEEPPRPSTRLSTLDAAEQTTLARQRQIEPIKWAHRIRGDLDWIVMKCLEKDRNRRYETANGLAADLKRHLANELIAARPPSTVYRLQKAWRRNKIAFTAGAVVAVSLMVGIGISAWQAAVATQAKTKAVTAQREAEKSQQAEKQQRVRADQERASAEGNLYAAKMNLAQQAWDQNNIGRLRQLLEDTWASADRGFEWYYWQQQTHLALRTLRGHLQGVSSVAFSSDGQRIVTGSQDNTAKVWEAASGRELFALKGHRDAIFSVAFSPDSQRIVTGSADNTAKVWEAISGRELLTFKGHRVVIYSVAFSPDGQRIVTGSLDQTAKVWDAASGRELLTLKGHTAPIGSVAFSADGLRILTGSGDQTAKVWEAASGRELLTLKGHRGTIYSVAFSPDGQKVVTSSEDQMAKVWEAATGRELLTLKGHTALIGSVAFSPDGLRILTGSGDQTAKVWETATGRELFALKGHSGLIVSVAFSPDSKKIVTGSDDQTAKVWDASTGLSSDKTGRETLALKGHSGEIMSVSFSPDSQRIVTGSSDQTAKMWEAASGRELLTLKGHSAPIGSVAFSPDSQRIVPGSSDQTAKVWEAANGRELLTLKGHTAPIRSVAFSPDGLRILTGSADRTAKVWEAASGRELVTLRGHGARIWSVAFSPDGRRILTGSDDQSAKVWDASRGLSPDKTGKELFALKGHTAPIRSVAFSGDGQRIVTGSADNTAKLWEAASGRELLTFKGHSAPIRSVAFSGDGQRLVTGSDDHLAIVWEATSGRELLTIDARSNRVFSVAFSAGGQSIAIGSDDQTAKVWQTARPEQVVGWQEEEERARRYLAVLRRENTAQRDPQRIARSRDEGAIKRWLVLAPITLANAQRAADTVDSEQIEGEGRINPKAGEGTVTVSGELKWQEVAQEDYAIDFNEILGNVTPQSVAYAVCYLRSEAKQRGLRMLVGSDDESKVYLNGKQIYKYPGVRNFVADQDTVADIALNPGLNVLVFKVVNETLDWQGSIRFTDAQGNPVKGIKATLDPEAKD